MTSSVWRQSSWLAKVGRFFRLQCDVISVAAEFMVSEGGSLLSPSVLRRNLQCQPVRGSGHPRGMPLATHLLELQPEEQRREANSLASSKARKLLSKKRTTQQPQPDDPNPNTAESMGEGGHRAAPGPAYGPVAKGSWLLEREEYTYSGFQHCIISL